MKKLLILLLALILCLALIACGDNGSTDDDDDDDDEPSYTEGLEFTRLDDGTYAVCGLDDETDVTDVVIPSSYNGKPVVEIRDYAFRDCTSLTSITIPNSVTSIGEWAFYNCTSLTSITIPNSVTLIGEGAFYNCLALKYTEYDNAYYLGNSENPYLVLIGAKDQNITSCQIHNDTRILSDHAFSNCKSLTSVTIGNSVKTIGDWAFYGCTSLTSVTIPNSVTSIGDYAFRYCDSLTIYCEAEAQPSGWNSDWNNSSRPVYWYSESEPTVEGNYWHYGENDEIVIWE